MQSVQALIDENEILRERVRQLERMRRRGERDVCRAFGLSPSQGRLLQDLMCGGVRTRDMLMDALYWDRPGEEPGDKILDVFILRLRERLGAHGIGIRTVWSSGYEMWPADIARANAVLDQPQKGTDHETA
jgi:two-component system cell cycle response regulator CtrA